MIVRRQCSCNCCKTTNCTYCTETCTPNTFGLTLTGFDGTYADMDLGLYIFEDIVITGLDGTYCLNDMYQSPSIGYPGSCTWMLVLDEGKISYWEDYSYGGSGHTVTPKLIMRLDKTSSTGWRLRIMTEFSFFSGQNDYIIDQSWTGDAGVCNKIPDLAVDQANGYTGGLFYLITNNTATVSFKKCCIPAPDSDGWGGDNCSECTQYQSPGGYLVVFSGLNGSLKRQCSPTGKVTVGDIDGRYEVTQQTLPSNCIWRCYTPTQMQTTFNTYSDEKCENEATETIINFSIFLTKSGNTMTLEIKDYEDPPNKIFESTKTIGSTCVGQWVFYNELAENDYCTGAGVATVELR